MALSSAAGGTMADDKATVIDAQADVDGKLKGKDAQIIGRFRGELELTGRLVLGEGARVDAKVQADAVEIAGEFKGEIKARTVTLAEKARVEASVDAQILVVREGAQLDGAIATGKGKAAAAPAPAPAAVPVTPPAAP
jgi:cytoskeletal protein CcmA (bactofilin family)